MQTRTGYVVATALVVAVSGCGSSAKSPTPDSTAAKPAKSSQAVNPNAKEKSPPGDIPDSTAFVRFELPGGGFSVRVPEGWARTGGGAKLTFTSNLNSVTVEKRPGNGPLTVASVKAKDVPALARSLRSFKLVSVATIQRSGGTAVRIRYLAKAAPNAVTGKATSDAAEQYIYLHNGIEAVVTLAGPKGADNVDAWRTISDSVRWAA